MTDLIVNTAGISLLVMILWWFWLYKKQSSDGQTESGSSIKIIIDGGVYCPDKITVNKDKPIVLTFIRKDPSPCAEWVIFNEIGYSQQIAVDTPTECHLDIKQPGHYKFSCQMGMYRGELIVK